MPLAFCGVGLGDIDRDYPRHVAGDHGRAVVKHRSGARQKIEGKAVFGILKLAGNIQPQAQQAVDQTMFGSFDPLPVEQVLRHADVRNRPVELAGSAVGVGPVGIDQPVAGIVVGVGAEPVAFARGVQRMPDIAVSGCQCGEFRPLGNIAENMLAALAPRILEIQQKPAIMALKKLHDLSPGVLTAVSRCTRTPFTAFGS